MKLIELISAARPLQKLIMQDVPLRTAYDLMQITEEVNPHLQFYDREVLKSGEDIKRIEELQNLEIDCEFKAVEISKDTDICLSASDVKLLQPIVIFTE